MLKNYLIIAFRNLWRRRVFSFLNISGLAIGMASAAIILLWIQNELSYDRFHEKGDRLYQVWTNFNFGGSKEGYHESPQLLAEALKQDYPEVEDAVRVGHGYTFLFTIGDKKLIVDGTIVDPGFLTMFSFPLIKGNYASALKDPHSIVLTQKLAIKLFGDEDPIGKVIKLDDKDNFTVMAILKDLPKNTLFDFEYLIPWSWYKMSREDSLWNKISTPTYVLLKSSNSLNSINEKIKNIIQHHANGTDVTGVYLFPMSKVRLYSSSIVENGRPAGGRIKIVHEFSIIAVFILLIACINFMNLSTAQSEKRAKEVGIRKVSGAGKGLLVLQFIGESVLLSVIAGIIALIIVQMVLPTFNVLVNEHLVIPYHHYMFWVLAISFILFTGILAGSYPAFYLSSFKPVNVLKGKFKTLNGFVTPRKVLIVSQFTISIVLIICSIIVRKQIIYGQERDSGYSKDNLIYVRLMGDIEKNFTLIKDELLNSNTALSVTKTYNPLSTDWVPFSPSLWWSGKDPKASYNYYNFFEDEDLVKTAGLHLTLGRDFNLKKYLTDSTGIILNESAVKMMRFNNPIGQIIRDHDINWHVVGVVKDFIDYDPYQPTNPMVIEGAKSHFNLVHIKFNKGNTMTQNLANAKKIFKQYNPQYPFEYHFIDEEYARKFEKEKLQGILSTIFTLLIIFISCLGLFGLSAFTAESRIKEIGVRKVLGASAVGIINLLNRDFIKLVVIAILISIPISWWSMNQWLAGYSYRTDLSWWVFVLAGLSAVFIAIATVSFQAIKAALANPVRSLRNE
jgi:putative ABC transport system permease protein